MNFIKGFSRNCGAAVLAATLISTVPVLAQEAPAAAAGTATRQLGTVKSVSGGTLSIATDKGATFSIEADPAAKVVQLAPGSTDLKTATPSTLDNIAVGDRVLVAGKTTDAPTTIHATRIVLMKSADIAQRNEQLQADWQKRGSGGIVSSVDPATGDVVIKSGRRTITLKTTPKTVIRRYSPGSVKYEDAKPSTLQELAAGDQLRVRGDRSEDGSTLTADEIVFGSFSNLAGTIVSVDAPGQTLVVKDLTAKKDVTVHLAEATNIRNLPPEIATRLVARARGGAAGTNGQTAPAGGAQHASAEGSAPASGEGMHRSGAGSRNMDFAQIVSRLPSQTIADLKPGEALMIVGSQSSPTAPLTAITILSGVEPILAATPSGSRPMTLSPWNLDSSAGGGGGPDMGDSGGSQQ